MSLKYIGKSGSKKVYVTPYSEWRLGLRHLSFDEAIKVLNKRDLSYPRDEEGRQKIRSKIDGKEAFLVIAESSKEIIIITGGES